ncbi:unnamed protein product, partial [Laminaria digitata]
VSKTNEDEVLQGGSASSGGDGDGGGGDGTGGDGITGSGRRNQDEGSSVATTANDSTALTGATAVLTGATTETAASSAAAAVVVGCERQAAETRSVVVDTANSSGG